MEDFKKLSLKFPNSTSKSSRNFENTEVVGLGIVAAMDDSEEAFASARFRVSAIFAPRSSSANSNPIDIVNYDSSRGGAFMEFCETYDPLENDTDTHGCLFQTSKFLEICFLCSKNLHGKDIFMYRGEKAFCSAECRSQQIANEDRKEKCGPGLNYSVSPCSGPMMFFAGVVAA